MKKCRFCAEEIQDAAIVCKHCGRDLVPSRSPTTPSQKVTVTGVDPFGHLHADIKGKTQGKITVVGYMGIGLGVLMVLVAGLALSQSSPNNTGGGFVIAMMGIGVSVASYLWVRR